MASKCSSERKNHTSLTSNQKLEMMGDFPGGPVVKNLPSNAGTWVRSLVRELRSHKQQGN